MKTLNHLILDIGMNLYEDEIKTKSGIILHVDTSYQPTHYQKIKGTLSFSSLKHPQIPIGATVYFPYLLSKEENIYKHEDGKKYLVVDGASCFCFVVDGVITMMNNMIFVRPHKEKPIDSLSAETILTLNLKHIEMLNTSEKSVTSGVVAYSNSKVKVGWSGVFKHYEAFENEIEGESLYVMNADDFLRVDDLIPELRNAKA